MPCTIKISSMKTLATVEGSNGCIKAQKWGSVERWSTTTKMTDMFLSFGRPTINSMGMPFHIVDGISSGCNAHRVFTVSFVFL